MFAQVPHHVGIGEEKNMNKLLKNKWFVRIISFFIALMLYTVVSAEQPPGRGTPPSSGGGNGNDEPQQLEDVKLVPYYDDDQYILSDLPETVSVQLEGSKSSITKASLSNGHEVFVDLTDKGAGTHTVPVQTRGFPKDLEVHTTPAKVKVSLQKKETKTFPVQVNLINKEQVADGYVAGKPETDPKEVAITAGKQAMDRIAFVEGFVDVKDADDTVKETVSLNVYDNKGNELDVDADPSKVGVVVPMEQQSKTVPIHVDQKGTLSDGLNMESIDLKSDEATLYGPKDVLDGIDDIKTSLDLSKIKKDTTVELDVTKPKGVNKITPEKVKADVNVTGEAAKDDTEKDGATKDEKTKGETPKDEETKEEAPKERATKGEATKDDTTKTIHNVPINVAHPPSGSNVSFLKPEDQQVDVSFTGSKNDLDDIKKTDVKAFIDANGLATGQHSTAIEINDLKNVEAHPEIDKAEIEITEEGG